MTCFRWFGLVSGLFLLCACSSTPEMIDIAEARCMEGQALMHADGNARAAIKTFDACLASGERTDERTASIHDGRGYAYQSLGLHQEAIADFDRAITLDPTVAFYFRNRATSRSETGDSAGAERDIRMAISLDPGDDEYHYLLGSILAQQHRDEDAVDALNEALRLNPDSIPALHRRAMSQIYLGNPEQGYADADRIIRLDETYLSAYLVRGVAAYHLGAYDQAVEDFDMVLWLDERNDGAFYYRGLSWFALGDDDKARADLERALIFDPGNEAYRAALSALPM